MLSRAYTATPWGIDALPVEIEVDLQKGLPTFQLVGLPDTAVRESRDRVRSAILNAGFDLKAKQTVINLAPADLRKEGNHLDLAIALALLAVHQVLPKKALEGRMMCGELGLDGALRPVRGALAIAALAQEMGMKELLLPADCAGQAAALRRVPVIAVETLSDAIAHLTRTRRIERLPPVPFDPHRAASAADVMDLGRGFDLRDVCGQATAKRALEVAAAGEHNLLFVGPPGSGKTLLAQTLPGLLPPLEEREALVVTKVHSLGAARQPPGLVSRRPFRAPHHSISTPGLIGGGSVPRPGEVSLAHGGVLFLDELPEFRKDALETLRQPLESGVVDIVRAKARFRFPARFQLLAAMNPCRCGYHGDRRRDCRCPPGDVARYLGRVSGPLLDRIDLQVTVPAVKLSELKKRNRTGETTAEVRQRVLAARARAAQRREANAPESRQRSAPQPDSVHEDGTHDDPSRSHGPRGVDAAAPESEPTIRRPSTVTDLLDDPLLTAPARHGIERAYDRFRFSARAVTRVLRVARTIADLDGSDPIEMRHVAEAIQYRVLGSEEVVDASDAPVL